MITAHVPGTEEEFDRWDFPEGVRAEWVDGEVQFLSPERPAVDKVRWFLQTLLEVLVKRRGLGATFGPNVICRLRQGLRRMPDVIFIPASELYRVKETYLEGAPSFALEVVSPESVERDWRQKFEEYREAGIQEYWITDLLYRKLQAYELSEGKYRPISEQDGRLVSRAVPGFWVNPEWLWQDPLPDVLDLLAEMGIL